MYHKLLVVDIEKGVVDLYTVPFKKIVGKMKSINVYLKR